MYSITLRYVRLWLARRIGRSYRWLFSEWRLPLFWLAVTALCVRVVDLWLDHPEGQSLGDAAEWWETYWWYVLSDGKWWGTYWWTILSVYALLVLLWWAWRTRKRVVVEEFVDHTNEQPKSAAGKTKEQPEPAAKGAEKQ